MSKFDKYSTERLRGYNCETLMARGVFKCEEKPDSHNCQFSCWWFKDAGREALLAGLGESDLRILEMQDEESGKCDQ